MYVYIHLVIWNETERHWGAAPNVHFFKVLSRCDASMFGQLQILSSRRSHDPTNQWKQMDICTNMDKYGYYR